MTIGFTPVLANQLAQPGLRRARWRRSSTQRLAACDEAPASLRQDRRQPPAAAGRVLARAADPAPRGCSTSIDGDLIGAFRALEAARPPRDHRLGRDARLPAAARARREHPAPARGRACRSTAGSSAARRRAAGCPSAPTGRAVRGQPLADRAPHRRCAAASRSTWPTRASASSSSTRTSRARAGRSASTGDPAAPTPSVHQPPRPGDCRAAAALALPGLSGRAAAAPAASRPTCATRGRRCRSGAGSRATRATARISSSTRCAGPAGSSSGGSRGPSVDLGAKQPYDPEAARDRARGHADHFAELLGGIAADGGAAPRRRDRGAVRHRALRPLVVRGARLPRRRLPRAARHGRTSSPTTGSRHLRSASVRARPSGCRAARGAPTATSACGSASRPRGPGSGSGRWRSAFWDAAPAALGVGRDPLQSWRRPRASCCWRSRPTGSSSSRPARRPTTRERRFREHCDDTEELVEALVDGSREALERGASARPRARRARRTSSPTCCPPSPPRSAGSRSLVVG